ncbi:MAG: BspA family leucine-rich repeat surface protein [Bacteroidales bacterium]|nr:BspA family leucine-rich repeat surface protein [Bacteroidales bacterium]
MKKALLFRLAVLVTAMMCALGAAAAEAYACYTPSNTTLTFYYDNLRSSRTGTTYDLNEGNNWPGWMSDGTAASVTRVVFNSSFAGARPSSTQAWFAEMTNLQSVSGMQYLNTSEVTNMFYMFAYCGLPSLNLSYLNTSNVTSMEGMFLNSSFTSLDVSSFNTSDVVYMNEMFAYCYNLTSLDLSTFNTSNVTNMEGMFNESNSLESINMSNWNTSNVTDMSYMFNECNALSSIDVSHFNTSKVTDMQSMFNYCTSLTSLDLRNFDTSKVTNMEGMFNSCQALESLNVSNWNTSNVTNMGNMFASCSRLTSLDLGGFNTSKVTLMWYMFSGCSQLVTIYAGSGWSTAAVTDFYSDKMFLNCTKIRGGQGTTYDATHVNRLYARIDGGTSNPGYFTAAPEAYACYTPSNKTLTFYYDNQRSSRTGWTYDLNTGNYSPGWYTDGTNANVSEVKFDPSFADARPTTCHSWFRDMAQLQTIYGLNYMNTSAVTHMVSMFRGCSSLTVLDLSSFSTANVIAMGGMFMGCSNLRTIYAGSGWSTAAVEASAAMFSNCTSLVGGQGTAYNSSNPKDKTYAHIDGGPSNPGYFTEKGPEAYACYTPSNTTLTFYYDTQRSSRTGTTYDLNTGYTDIGWQTDGTNASVTKVVFDPSFAGARPTITCVWFYGMTNLQSITGLSYLNTSEVTDMSYMFAGCEKLTSVDVSHFNTSKVIYMGRMFDLCTRLTSLDLSSFNTSHVAEMRSMFSNCSNLRTIYVGSGWSTAAVMYSTEMFWNCICLVGGQGTTWNSSNPTDKTYAHIDGGTSNPGYFTDGNGPRPYACYTPSNTTLTFYYDNQRSSRTGTTYDLNTGDNYTGWDTDGTKSNVTKVVFDPSFANARPTTTYGWFYYMQNLQSITGLSYLNTSEVTDMGSTFTNCKKLTSLDVSHFNTSKVIYMNQMFYGCTGLTSLDLSSFNTSNVTNMRYMFAGSSNLRTIYVGSGWSTAAVTSSGYMFNNCTSLVGGQGTTYDANHIDKTYAHIDGGPSNPGYFTAKNAGLRGDVNGDGSVNISDVTALIDLLLGGGTISNPAADCNQDSSVNISDVTALIDYLLSNHW